MTTTHEKVEALAVTVVPTGPEHSALLSSLIQLYLHDLTAFTEFYELDDGGRFQPDYLRAWVERSSPALLPFLIRVEGRPAGFALVATKPYPLMGKDRDHRVCELFVLNALRRRGVGRAAAKLIFAQMPGAWEVSELPENERAISFWRAVVGEVSSGRYTESVERGDVTQVFTV